MTVLGITTAASPYQSGLTSRAALARQDFKDLGTALSSGDLSTAQQAFDSLQQNLPGAGRAKGQNSDSARQTIQDLGSALQSGNITDAQQAYAKLQQNMGEIKGRGHYNHHNHKGGNSRTEDSASAASPATTATPGIYTSEGVSATTTPSGAPDASVIPGAATEIDIKA